MAGLRTAVAAALNRSGRWPRAGAGARSVDLGTDVGGVPLRNPILTAAGTVGHGTEVGAYLDLAGLGAVVVKSLSPEPWAGNPGPRVAEVDGGMLNSVGLQNPGVEEWLRHDLPALLQAGATVVASIWGRRVGDYERAAQMLRGVTGVVAVEVNLSCPNLDGGAHMFAQDRTATIEAIAASAACGLPRWAKLAPLVNDIASIAGAAHEAGASAVTLINTIPGMALDVERRLPVLGGRSGGLSGPAIRPVAVKAVHDVRAALPHVPIVGVGGVARGVHAVELLMAGACAVQVGTASFFDPAAPARVLQELRQWCHAHSVSSPKELIGVVHDRQ